MTGLYPQMKSKFFTWFILLELLTCGKVAAVDRITATLTITNAPSDGAYITLQGSPITFKTTVTDPTAQVLINASVNTTTTNLYNQTIQYPVDTVLILRYANTNSVSWQAPAGQALTASVSAAFGYFTLSTQAVTISRLVRVPLSVETASVREEVSNYLVDALNDYATGTVDAGAASMANYVNLSGTQTITGTKTFTSISSSIFEGATLTNGFQLSLTAAGLTPESLRFYDNGGALEAILSLDTTGAPTLKDGTGLAAYAIHPTTSHLVNRSMGNLAWGQLTNANTWTGHNQFSVLTNSTISGSWITNSYVSATNGILDGLTLTNGVFQGSLGVVTNGWLYNTKASGLYATNATMVSDWQANDEVAFPQLAHTSFANGNNAAADFGDTLYVKIKAGPTGAFTLAGIQDGRDGRMLILHNATGQNMTLANDSGIDPTASNRIYTLTGSDITTTGDGSFTLIYDSDSSRWIVTAYNQ